MKIGVYETNLSNKFSIFHAFEYLNFPTRIIEDANDLEDEEILIIPGVGNFSKLINSLQKRDQISSIIDQAKNGKKILGICLGMQILFSSSEEGNCDGIGLLDGVVKNLDNKFSKFNLNTPNIGWRRTIFENEYFEKYNNNYFYFVHQYEVIPNNKKEILSYSNIKDTSVVSAVYGKGKMENIYGIQFHPEKSGLNGIEFLKDLVNYIMEN